MPIPDSQANAPAIEALLDRCNQAEDARKALRDLRSRCPELLTRVCLQWLATRPIGEREEVIRGWLIARGEYLGSLLDSRYVSHVSALRAAQVVCVRDPELGRRLYAIYREKRLDRPMLIRLLHIIDHLHIVDRVVPLIRELSSDGDQEVRANAVAVYSKARPNRANIERLFTSEDPRVRAGAVEALWHTRTDFTVELLRQAVYDSHPRVVANAILGLYYAGEPDVVDLLRVLLSGAPPELAAALAWAMGRMHNAGIADLLKVLTDSEHGGVRAKAEVSLRHFAAAASGSYGSSTSE